MKFFFYNIDYIILFFLFKTAIDRSQHPIFSREGIQPTVRYLADTRLSYLSEKAYLNDVDTTPANECHTPRDG